MANTSQIVSPPFRAWSTAALGEAADEPAVVRQPDEWKAVPRFHTPQHNRTDIAVTLPGGAPALRRVAVRAAAVPRPPPGARGHAIPDPEHLPSPRPVRPFVCVYSCST